MPPECPALILHGGRDRIFPVEEARRSADFAQGECVIFPEGNHVCNNIPWRYRPPDGGLAGREAVGDPTTD